MARWRVQLTGDVFELEDLPGIFDDDALRVVRDGDRFHLEAAELSALDTAEAVRSRAAELVSGINGAMRLQYATFRPIALGSVVARLDPESGVMSITIESGIEARAKMGAVVVTSDGVRLPTPAQPAVAWAAKAARDPTALRVLRLLAKAQVGWNELYKVHEILLGHSGKAAQASAEITDASVDRFTQTANSYGALGAEARHASAKVPPPPKPMTLEEARILIHDWSREWLSQRGDVDSAT